MTQPTGQHVVATLIRTACSARIVRNALQVSAVVGTLLNIINQGGALWAGDAVSWPHIALNYLVPYCVASYSAARNQLARTPGTATTNPDRGSDKR